MKLSEVGEECGRIPVNISYNIIELFSKQLYSSTNKAFEELVCNSYDADANMVAIYLPDDLSNAKYIWVIDNGKGMNATGLKDLWKIGTSSKREFEKEIAEQGGTLKRKQIGKFGIGKLATYVITNELTYLCKSTDGYFSTTMDYSNISKNQTDDVIVLSERELAEEEAKNLIRTYLERPEHELIPFELFGHESPDTWTFCLMTTLKPKAAGIQRGRLEWILQTALPLNPNFGMYINGKKIASSKEKLLPAKEWKFGSEEDTVAGKSKEITKQEIGGEPVVNLPHLKGVRGQVTLYNDSIASGKSESVGRSNGIFLMVRDRLINIDDPLLGMAPLQHGAFARMRMVVYADELDDYLTSGREAIQDGAPLDDLKRYLNSFFYSVVRPKWDEISRGDKKDLVFHKLAKSSGNLTRIPLNSVVKRIALDGRNDLLLSELDPAMAKDDAFSESVCNDIFDENGIIKNIERAYLGPERPIAILDYKERSLKVNLAHPFIAVAQEDLKNPHPIEMMAVAEVLAEAQLVELGYKQDDVREYMEKRDRTLRTLSYGERRSAVNVAVMLTDAVNAEKPLEEILCDAFSCLGFEAVHIGGSGKPDGLASAHLGYKHQTENNYKIVLDAKSTSHDKVKAGNIHIATSKGHQDAYEADYTVIVGGDFDGSNDDKSTLCTEAVKHKVTLIRARDLSRLLLLSSPKMLTLSQIRQMLDTCFKPNDVREWIDQLEKKEVGDVMVRPFINTIFKLQKDDHETPEFASVRIVMMRDYPHIANKVSIEGLRSLAKSLKQLIPDYIEIEDNRVTIESTPDRILGQLFATIKDVDPAYMGYYLSAFKDVTVAR